MVFGLQVGPNQSIERGQFRVAKSLAPCHKLRPASARVEDACSDMRRDSRQGGLTLMRCDFLSKDPQLNRVGKFNLTKSSQRERASGFRNVRCRSLRIRIGCVQRHEKAGF